MSGENHTISRRLAAWGVHVFTALGTICALMAIIAISKNNFAECMLWLLVAFLIDGFDGILARKVGVLEVLPYMSGKNIDFVVDFATYAIIPAYFLYQAHWVIDGEVVYLLPEPEWIRILACSVLLLVSAIYYGKEPMVSEDMYFIGFPVMWNAVAFFMFFVFRLSDWGNFAAVIVFSVLHFVPLKYAYPSRGGYLKYMIWIVGMTSLFGTGMLLYLYPVRPWYYVACAVAFLPLWVYHTLWITFKKD